MKEHSLVLAVTYWKDKRDVSIFTACADDGKTVLRRHGNEIRALTVIKL